MKPLPRAAPGSVVTLEADLFNYIAENLERLDKWAVKPPLSLHQTAAGNLLSVAPSAGPLALVAILGPEPTSSDGGSGSNPDYTAGGGRYRGTILSGNSTGSTTTQFQLQPSTVQSATDGPKYATTTPNGSIPVNNALVINVPEQYVKGSHLLYSVQADLFYAVGRIMGQTSESTPRTIVYIGDWPIRSVVAKITGSYLTTYGGVYRGEIARGQFANSQNSYASPMANYANQGITGQDNCWIVNNWEQTYRPNSGLNALATGTYVWGMMAGFPVGAFPGGQGTNDIWYMVYTWFPPQSAAVTIQSVVTFQSAGSTYGSNEQNMLNNLKTDVTNLRSELNSLYTNLKNAGYSL